MALITPTPKVLKDCTISIKIGAAVADDYAPAVSSVTITPTAAATSFVGVGIGATFTDTAPATWAAGLSYVQDWDSAKSLSRFLFENEGKVAEIEFRPRDKSQGFAVTATLTPGAIGGAAAAYPTATVNLGVSGRPRALTVLP